MHDGNRGRMLSRLQLEVLKPPGAQGFGGGKSGRKRPELNLIVQARSEKVG